MYTKLNLYKFVGFIYTMRVLSNKEKKELKSLLPIGYEIDKKDEITENNDVLFKNNESFLIILEKNKKQILKLVPHLKSLNDDTLYKSVYVDRGAIPFIIKGADLMRPGIQKIEDGFDFGDVIIIRDEEHSKNLAIGKSLFSSVDMNTQEKGKSIEIFHYFGDEFY